MKLTKEIVKQQQPAVAETPEAIALLKGEGFTEDAAKALAANVSPELIRQQIEWLARRAPSRSRLGMLRRAIEEGWPEPEELRHAEVIPAWDFAQNFYAELAGNPGLPVAEPSSRDLQVAESFIARLVATAPVKVEPVNWARAFAGYVRERKRDGDLGSLVLALRLHGDAWLLRFAREQERERREAVEAARSAHRIKHEHAWLEFVTGAERTCRASKPDEYTVFERRVENERWHLSGPDKNRERLLAFQRHFLMPNFWHWDAEFNSEPFSPCA